MKHDVTETENTACSPEAARKTASGKAKAHKIFSIAIDVVLYFFLALCLFVLIVSVVSKKNDGAVNLFGNEIRIVTSSSMAKSEYSVDVSDYKIKNLEVRSAVFIKRVPANEQKAKEFYSKLRVGDVLTFKYDIARNPVEGYGSSGGRQTTITHRIVEIQTTETGYIIKLKGDNRHENGDVSTQTVYTSSADYPSADEQYNYVIGKVTSSSFALGNLIYALKQPVGIVLMIIVPCCLVIVWQVIRIVTVVSEDRKQKAKAQLDEANAKAAAESEERARQAREYEELKKQFEELKKQQKGRDGGENGE